ncbi:hypothetical protein [Rugosimonospora africana]|uniref:Uncharacterized protein n=1 Tax=Rugosimonospora africana TaxID=556532 RepID=A0A8J3R2V6_9ACTN|nr:hypothetical protein [Rugosimonospora africana]GIH21256.1 hypothetical protein Raf01_94280 [Rugosimonospora africana]
MWLPGNPAPEATPPNTQGTSQSARAGLEAADHGRYGRYDKGNEFMDFEQAHPGGGDPLIGEAEVIGLYPASHAAAASKWTTTIGDSDNSSRLDD